MFKPKTEKIEELAKKHSNVISDKFYNGTLYGDNKSEAFMHEVKKYEDGIFGVKTKPVKILLDQRSQRDSRRSL